MWAEKLIKRNNFQLWLSYIIKSITDNKVTPKSKTIWGNIFIYNYQYNIEIDIWYYFMTSYIMSDIDKIRFVIITFKITILA